MRVYETLLKSKSECEIKDDKKYEIKTIINSVVSNKEIINQIPALYYLVL